MALGPWVLELGSLFYNCWCIDRTMRAEANVDLLLLPWPRRPDNAVALRAYVIVMSLSNAGGVWALCGTAGNLAAHGHAAFAVPLLLLVICSRD